jgi:hypothetical protein
MIRELDEWYATLLDITPATTAGRTIIDLGGGPWPLAVTLDLPFERLVVVDPLCRGLFPVDYRADVLRVAMPAEDWIGMPADEVWGYNVLQHVMDPSLVMDTARRHAASVVRWFDWTDTVVEAHHPHSIRAEWLLCQFPDDRWEIVSEVHGSVLQPIEQSYVAVVARRRP